VNKFWPYRAVLCFLVAFVAGALPFWVYRVPPQWPAKCAVDQKYLIIWPGQVCDYIPGWTDAAFLICGLFAFVGISSVVFGVWRWFAGR
jgi:hypothetical protein